MLLSILISFNISSSSFISTYIIEILICIVIVAMLYRNRKTLKDQSAMQAQMKYTIYFMLVIIFIASLTLPTALGIYWITSSLFTILQNIWVERKKVK